MSETPKLIVVMAFDLDESGDPQSAFEPLQFQSEARAISYAKGLTGSHAGVIAWSREANPDIGDYGESEVLFTQGIVPELD